MHSSRTAPGMPDAHPGAETSGGMTTTIRHAAPSADSAAADRIVIADAHGEAAWTVPTARAVVAIPAFEPGPELVALVDALVGEGVDVLVIDDGSGPRFRVTFDRCELIGADVVSLPVNRGKGSALRVAFARAQELHPGAGVVTADADGQHTPADIRLIRTALEGLGALVDHHGAGTGAARSPIVLGVRAFTGGVPLRSRLGNAVSALAFRVASGVRLGDTQTGLRGIPAVHLDWAQQLPGDRYEYEASMLMRAAKDGIGLHQIPIETVYEPGNPTSHFRPIRDSARVLAPVVGPMLGFMGSSFSTFLLDTLLFWALTAAGLPIWGALTAARLVSSTANFSLNRWVVFRGTRRPLLASVLGYGAVSAVVLLGGIGVVSGLSAIGIPVLIAKLIADLGLFALSYAAQRFVVFCRV